MTIKILSNSTINKIAAGEVIERPASVVKELVENAIDAGSSKIQITLEQAGKNLIVISDDGIGMSKDEIELAVQRHATSKLDEDDLLNINSFGFRGEALPSIGAISKFKITSRKKGSDLAHSLVINGGEVGKPTVASAKEGTTIEIRDLFFATPARLKFLRTDRTELGAIVSIVKRMALGHSHIAFSLVHDGRELIKVRNQSADAEENLKNRICEIVGNDFIENSVHVSLKRDEIELYGYSSLPTFNKAASEDQFLFINNRPVKDKILNIALKVAYQDFLARDRHAVAVLFLKMPPQMVDVNVHPAKTEVRFHDPNTVRGVFISAIKDALNSSSHRVSNTVAATAINKMQQNISPSLPVKNSTTAFREKEVPQGKFQMPYSNYQADNNVQVKNLPRTDYVLAQQSESNLIDTTPYAKSDGNKETIIDDKEIISANYPLGAAKAQLHSTYIVAQTEDSIVVVDQHAAHERLGYEKIKEQIAKNGLIKQRLLIPEIVELPDEQRAELINEHKEQLEKLGLSVEKFGEKSIVVSEIPSLVGDINPGKLILDLADYFSSTGENIALTELIEHVTETYACHYAIRAGRKLSVAEMNEMLRQMENTPFSGQCNHGRPTYVELKLKDIEKLFGRR